MGMDSHMVLLLLLLLAVAARRIPLPTWHTHSGSGKPVSVANIQKAPTTYTLSIEPHHHRPPQQQIDKEGE